MIRSRASDDGVSAQVRLSPREVARAVEDTGLPAAAFEGEEFVVMYPEADVRTPRGYAPPMPAMVTDGPADVRARAWVRDHASALPRWRARGLYGEEDLVDEFVVAGHRARVDGGQVVEDWADERGEPRLGLTCARCGYVALTQVDEVPECGGTPALLRRLHARRTALLGKIIALDAEISEILENAVETTERSLSPPRQEQHGGDVGDV